MKQFKVKRDTVIKGLLVALVAIAFFNFFITFSLSGNISTKIKEQKEVNRPANLELTKITVDCDYCFSVDSIENRISSSSKTNITSQKMLSRKEASDLINQYNIEKLPTLIVKGETDKSNAASLFSSWTGNNVKVFNQQKAPYLSMEENEIVGEVTATLIQDSSCENCYDLNSALTQIENQEVYFAEKNNIEYNSTKGKDIVKKYNIGKIPTVIFNDQLQYYDIYSQIEQINEKINGKLVMETPTPPYVETDNNTVKGLVDIIYLVDNFCEGCYDISLHKQILQGMGMVLDNETTVDVNSDRGQSLVNKYNMKAVPATIISKEAGDYSGFETAWSQVGKVVNNTYIFTSTEWMAQQGKYVDLETGEVKGGS